MSDIVLDASALLALLQGEKGHDEVERLLLSGSCLISTVNLSEVIARLIDTGMSFSDACLAVSLPNLHPKEFDLSVAKIAASLRPDVRKFGLSLGDRACLALARASVNAEVYTADAIWRRLSIPDVSIHVIR